MRNERQYLVSAGAFPPCVLELVDAFLQLAVSTGASRQPEGKDRMREAR